MKAAVSKARIFSRFPVAPLERHFNRLSLRTRIYTLLGLLLFITLSGALIMIGYTFRIENLLNRILEKDVAGFQAAEAMETALINQKGFISYYFIDGDDRWLRELGKHRKDFSFQLQRTRERAPEPAFQDLLNRIEERYALYTHVKDQVIELYRQGDREAGARLHSRAREIFPQLLSLCENYKELHTAEIREAQIRSSQEATRLRFTAVMAMFVEFSLAILLMGLLIKQILTPVRRLAERAEGPSAEYPKTADEIKALSHRVEGLIKNAGRTEMELIRSRENLLQSGKMAMVGKLAANTAHSIRNPLTSVKMRLFSLGRSIRFTGSQREDFDVISQEIRHIDTIISNFLEFARPPRLKMQPVNPSAIADMALLLLKHRLQSHRVTVNLEREGNLPEIDADPEQLKEAMVNLIVNACEAIKSNGTITVREEVSREPGAEAVVIRIIDSGPGIPEGIKEKLFDPFFTTKEEGTGLGLSISSRIIEEHGGFLGVFSEEGKGADFTITLPLERPRDDKGEKGDEGDAV